MKPIVILPFLAILCGSVGAQGDLDEPVDLPRIQPLEPRETLNAFEIVPGRRIELVAAEPLVRDPVALAFDEQSRLYVVEMRDYSEQRDERLGSIRRLVDRDGDGRYDTSELFAEGLPWPTAIACWRGGVFVGAAPDVLYLRDRDGDGRADERRVALTGFLHGNVQGLLNSFRYGPDHRIHGATSRSGGRVRRPGDDPSTAVELRNRDFSFDPDTGAITATSGGGQHGMDFDGTFAKFACSNSNHAQHVLYPHVVLERHPFVESVPVLRDIAVEGPQADVHRASPIEPWRILRTRWRVAGLVPGPIERGGRPAGYFTGATGLTVFEDELCTPEVHATWLIIGDVGSNLVHRKLVERNGLSFVARRVDEGTEFLRSRDPWFRPVTFRCGPEGALYVADMYRETIEHPASLPPPIKERLDLTSGRDRGRIYRIVPEEHVTRALPNLEHATDDELATLLSSTHTWQRTTALRLLHERGSRGAVPRLRKLAREAGPTGRVHALSALAGLDALSNVDLEAALRNPDPRVRAFVLEWFPDACMSTENAGVLALKLAADDDVLVRHRCAIAATALPEALAFAVLLRIAQRDDASELTRQAIESSIDLEETAAFLRHVLHDASESSFPERTARVLFDRALRHGSKDSLNGLLDDLENLATSQPRRVAFAVDRLAVGSTSATAGTNPPELTHRPSLRDAVQRVRTTTLRDVADASLELDVRRRAVERLGALPEREALPHLVALLDPREPALLQIAALTIIERYRTEATAESLLGAWRHATPDLRGRIAQLLVARTAFARKLLDAVGAGSIPWAALPLHVRERLLAHPDGSVRRTAQELESTRATGVPMDERRMVRTLSLTGDFDTGRAVFRATCATCHRLEDHGFALGPDLRGVRGKGREALLHAILEPNRDVDPRYVDYLVELVDGRLLTGLVEDESEHAFVLRGPNGFRESIARRDVLEIGSTGRSLMPEKLLDTLDASAIASLLRYLEEN